MIKQLKSVFKQSFIYGAGNMITKASGIILLPIYLLYITEEEFGLLALFEVLFIFLVSISGWGIKGGFTRWYYEFNTELERQSLFFTTYTFNVFTSTFGLLLTAVIIWNIPIFRYNNESKVLLWFCFASLFRLLYDVPFILLKLLHKSIKQTIYQSINVLLTIAFTYLFIEIRKEGFVGIFKAQMFANGLTLLMIIPVIIENSYPSFNKKILKEMFQYGYPLAISIILTQVFTMSDRYIIEHFNTLTEVGNYTMAYKISNLLQILVVASFSTSYTYHYYKSINEKDGSRFHIKTFTYFVFFMTLLGLGIIFFGKEIIYVLSSGNQNFYEALPIIPILIIGLIFSGMRQVFILPITKAKKTRLISKVMILAGVLNIVLNIIFIPIYGNEGAAATTTISQLFAVLWFLIEVRKLEPTKYETKKIFLSLGLGILFYILFTLIPQFNLYTDTVIKFTLLLLFLLSLYWLNFFEKIEILRLKEVIFKWTKLKI